MLSVGEVAKLAGISVRTLHHYDEIGLLVPSERSDAGYRMYSHDDLERLQRILVYRELGFSLERIRELVSDPDSNRREALADQRRRTMDRIGELHALVDLIDRTLASIEEGTEMPPEEMLDVFGDFDPTRYRDEVEERWGETEAYRESARRTRTYTRDDWRRIRDENESLLDRLVDALDRGVHPTDAEAMDLAEEARLAIDRAFYPCSREMHAALAEGYTSDERFRAFYDNHRDGLAAWFADSIRANGTRNASED